MKPIRTAFLAAALSGCCVLGFAQGGFGQQGARQDGFRGVQRGFGTRQNATGPRQGGFGMGQNRMPSTTNPTMRPANDAARPGTASKRPFGAGPNDTSAYMAGEIYVNVVLFESNGKTDPDTENWTKAEIEKVVGHIRNACHWWEEMWKRKKFVGKLHFTLGLEHAETPFQTSYEPITHSAFREDRLWICEYLNSLGYSGDKNRMLYQYTGDLIARHDADFAFSVFVVKADNDRDHYFSDNYRSYAFGQQDFNSCNTYVLTAYSRPYDWYSSQSFAHEMAHIFGAEDEYPGQGNYNDRGGYYGVQNTNAPDGHPNRNAIVPSLMNSSISTAFERHTTSPQSLEMVGWRDSDGDGIIDVLDAPIEVTEFSSKLNLTDSNYQFSGTFTVQKVPNHNRTKAITINSVDRLLYRYGASGEWKSTEDKDWGEESRVVSCELKLPKDSVLQWKVVDSDGTTESKTYTIGGVRDPKVAVSRERRAAKFSFTPATADTGIVGYKLRVDEKVYDLAEQDTFTLSGIPSGPHKWALQGVYADSSATDWMACGTFAMPAQTP